MGDEMSSKEAAVEEVKHRIGRRGSGPRTVTFLPEPERRRRYFPMISVDDHVVEPAHTFEGRLPRKLQDRAPHIVESEAGVQEWVYEDLRRPHIGLNAVAGRPLEELAYEPARFDEMRPGAYDPDARVRDMDINGVYGSLNFPSGLGGFAGQRLQVGVADTELALAVVRAWNDWYLEEWAQPHPDRFIPCQLAWLRVPEVAAAEIRRNAERGFKAVTFPEGPHELGLPSLHSGHWDPFLAACEETETVVCLHVGSSSTSPVTASDAPADTVGVLFFGYAMFFAVDWLYSMVPLRYPNLRICLSEGGLGWVAGLIDRLDHVHRYDVIYGNWPQTGPSPSDVFRRAFYFCALDDRAGLRSVDYVGADHVMLEADYPHLSSMWPDTQVLLHEQLAVLDDATAAKVAWANASRLFRHPVPDSVQRDPESF